MGLFGSFLAFFFFVSFLAFFFLVTFFSMDFCARRRAGIVRPIQVRLRPGAALGAAQGWWAGGESAARAGGRCTFGGMAGDALLAVSGLWVLSRWCSWCCECGDE